MSKHTNVSHANSGTAGLQAWRGELVDWVEDPRVRADALRHVADGVLVVQGGYIVQRGPADEVLASLPSGVHVHDLRGSLILPGFVDAHVHYVQTDVIASHGRQLLDWLEDYTFPEEARFRDPDHARATAEFFLDELLRHGTTTAAVYASSHPASVEAFFTAAQARGLRMVCGKVMMDRHCPEAVRDTAAQSYEDSAALIERWHGRDRLQYAVTPRFAPTSSDAQLRFAGRLLDEHPGVRMQTHIAENHDEMRWVRELYPDCASYLEVYERFGLLRPGALLAHGIHFDEADWRRLVASGAAVVHCPTSNLFLGSGLFSQRRAREHGARVAMATDVGGGTSFGMLPTLLEASKVAQLEGSAYDASDAFYQATLGGARALGLADCIGRLEPGLEADFIVLDPRATPLLERRLSRARSLLERLFVFLALGDDRAVARCHVMGKLQA